MHGFKIAIATKDGEAGDLISIGTGIGGEDSSAENGANESTVIKTVDISFDTVDNNVKRKSGSMLAKIEIKGEILGGAGLRTKYEKLSEWAHDRSADTAYRDICIAVKADADTFQVVYVIKNVFVVDYKEVYVCDGNENEEKDRFDLSLTQMENNLDKIEILSSWPSDQRFGSKG
jgi:hypothetical protein